VSFREAARAELYLVKEVENMTSVARELKPIALSRVLTEADTGVPGDWCVLCKELALPGMLQTL
jgi:hypothetical protein